MFKKIKDKISNINKIVSAWFGMHPAVMAIVLAVSITLVNEILSRRSFISAVIFMFTRPHIFLCNAVIIFIFEAFGLLFKKRNYMMAFFSVSFLVLGITNFILRCFRQTPFSAMDFILLKNVFPILEVYLSVIGLIAVIAVLVALIVFLIVLWKKAKKTPVKKKCAAITLLSSILSAAIIIGSCNLLNVFPHHFSNLADAYRDYGFTYCFTVGIFDRGISKPSDYEDKIQDVVSDVLATTGTEKNESTINPETEDNPSQNIPDNPSKKSPNIIFVQLESFYDIKLLKGFAFENDPVPYFTELKENYPHGNFHVPSIGAGTANTEFEVLSGMSLKWFGAGEYPYETVLQDKTCETICYNLSHHGYTAHAIHNYKGNFYGRNNVFGHLGFNTFTPIEYMNGKENNPIGWAKDYVLTRYILSALNSTEGPDFVHCITVQGHGKYPTKPIENAEHHVNITNYPEKADPDSFTYFADQLYETDEFIGKIIASVKALGEDTIIVFFGDHIPNIGIKEEWLTNDMSLFDTEYIIWNSWQSEEKRENINSYQLSAKIMSMLGWNDGVLTKLHQEWYKKDTYQAYLEMLEYDILYGECFAYGGQNPFKPTDLKLGIDDIKVTDIKIENGNTYITGENFTKSSKVYLNNLPHKTEFISETKLVMPNTEVDSNDEIQIVQVTDVIFRMGETEKYNVGDFINGKH